jgi:hypothetical protein
MLFVPDGFGIGRICQYPFLPKVFEVPVAYAFGTAEFDQFWVAKFGPTPGSVPT